MLLRSVARPCTKSRVTSLPLRLPIGYGASYRYIPHHPCLQATQSLAGFLFNLSEGHFGMGQPGTLASQNTRSAAGAEESGKKEKTKC
jgi:hypothetical protein